MGLKGQQQAWSPKADDRVLRWRGCWVGLFMGPWTCRGPQLLSPGPALEDAVLTVGLARTPSRGSHRRLFGFRLVFSTFSSLCKLEPVLEFSDLEVRLRRGEESAPSTRRVCCPLWCRAPARQVYFPKRAHLDLVQPQSYIYCFYLPVDFFCFFRLLSLWGPMPCNSCPHSYRLQPS